MQLSVPWRSGLAKPFASIPRINWSHSLAKGLATYCFDCGGGVLIDLVSGGQGVKQTAGSPTAPSIITTPWGQNWSLAQQSSTSNGVGLVFPSSPRANNMASAFPYSFASGFIFKSCLTGGSGVVWSVCDTGNNTNFAVQLSISGTNTAAAQTFFGNSGGNIVAASNFVVGNFSTVVGVATGASTCTQYFADNSGTFKVATGASAATNSPTTYQPIFGDGELTAGGTGGHFCEWGGSVFYGAAWANRALTQSEARQLASDPWCLLWWPEDDIFASLVGGGLILLPQRMLMM